MLKHRSLQELEINGRHYGDYDPMILPQFTSIRRIKLIMPTLPVVEALPAWLRSLVDPLQSLSIVCKVRATFSIRQRVLPTLFQNRTPRSSQMRSWNEYLEICPVSTNFT